MTFRPCLCAHLLLTAVAGTLHAGVATVSPPGGIQLAIDGALANADADDTIFVESGTYHEALFIDYTGTPQRSLQIIRQGATNPRVLGGITIRNARLLSLVGLQVDSPHEDDVAGIRIVSSEAVSLIRCRGTAQDDGGVDATDCVELTLDHCSFGSMRRRAGDGGFGARIVGGRGHVVKDTDLRMNAYLGLWLEADLSTVQRCDVSGNLGGSYQGGGLFVDGLRNNVRDCLVNDNEGYGLDLDGMVTVRNNQVKRNGGVGIRLGSGGDVILHGSEVSDNRVKGNDGVGILIRSDQSACEVRGNRVSDNGGAGIRIQSDGNLIASNRCRSNRGGGGDGHGIQIGGSSRRNFLKRNTLSGNEGEGISVLGRDNLVVENRAQGDDGIVEEASAQGNSGHANRTVTGRNDFR